MSDGMEGYRRDSYGEGFADVYDDWYADISPADRTAAFVAARTPGPVLELGSGTGRLAGPLAALGVPVVGLDSSASMLARARHALADLPMVRADMTIVPARAAAFGAVLIGFNTLFNVDDAGQRACLADAARAVAADGVVIVETFVPGEAADTADQRVDVVRLDADVVVLRVSRSIPDGPGTGTVSGSHVELRDGEPVRLRPWQVRFRSPSSLDELATGVGLVLAERYADWDGAPFGPDSGGHVSVYRPQRAPSRPATPIVSGP